MQRNISPVLHETRGHIELKWEIPNFLGLPQGNGEELSSPTFLLGDANWKIVIYPKGDKGNVNQTVGLFLTRIDNPTERVVLFSTVIKIGELILKRLSFEHTFNENTVSWGYPASVGRSTILPGDDTVTFLFTIRLLKFDGRFQDGTSQTPGREGVVNLSRNLEKFYLSGRLTDVKLNVQGREFSAHKLVLGACSPVFDAMFDTDMVEKNSGVVEISDLNPESFHEFLRFMYSGNFDLLTAANALELCKAADKYDLRDFRAECLLRHASWLTVDNIFDVILLAEAAGGEEING